MCISCFFLNLKLSLYNCNVDKKKEYLFNLVLYVFELLLNNFYNYCVNLYKYLKMLFLRLVFDILLLV